jgi:hypothetical protein
MECIVCLDIYQQPCRPFHRTERREKFENRSVELSVKKARDILAGRVSPVPEKPELTSDQSDGLKKVFDYVNKRQAWHERNNEHDSASDQDEPPNPFDGIQDLFFPDDDRE